MTRVKNQGICLATCAFAATAVLEAFIKRKYNQSYVISEQSVINCTYEKYRTLRGELANNGCVSGLPALVFIYFNETGSITEDQYPYRSGATEQHYKCKNVRPKTNCLRESLKLRIVHATEEEMKDRLVTKGPFVIASSFEGENDEDREERFIDAGSGVFDYNGTSNGTASYGVVVVGYGTTKTNIPFWTVRSSWSPGWGVDGYGRIRRGKNIMNLLRNGATFVE